MAAGRGRALLRGGGALAGEGPARGARIPGPPRLTPPGPVFRPTRPGDARFLADLAAEAFGGYGDYVPMVAAWAADAHVEGTLVEQDGAPAGAALLVFLRPAEAPETRVADLLALAVAAPFRGKGLGRALLAHVLERAREVSRRHGIDAVRLAVAEVNTSARRLFESAGFHYTEEQGVYPRGQKALHMVLPLRGAGGDAQAG